MEATTKLDRKDKKQDKNKPGAAGPLHTDRHTIKGGEKVNEF